MIEGYNKCKAIFDIYKKLGHLNKISAPGAGIETNPSSKVQIPGGCSGGRVGNVEASTWSTHYGFILSSSFKDAPLIKRLQII